MKVEQRFVKGLTRNYLEVVVLNEERKSTARVYTDNGQVVIEGDPRDIAEGLLKRAIALA